MVKRRVKKKQATIPVGSDSEAVKLKEPQIEEQEDLSTDPDVERQSVAVRAIRDVEIDHLLTEIRLLRSYFNEENLQTPVLKFFEENFPDLSVVKSGENGRSELKWKNNNNNKGKVPMENTRDVHASLLHRLSVARSDYSGPFSSFGGFDLSTKTAKTRILGLDNLQIRNFVLEEPSENQMLGMHDAFQTPGISSQRVSIGMTPKTLRLPKPGEMLLSVCGSPLGIYEQENMEAICESEES